MLEAETSAPAADAVTYRDKEGQLLTLGQWSRLHADRAYRLHKDTEHQGALVRTMWEGIDDGVEVACQWHTGVRDAAGGWHTVWEGYWPCSQADAEAQHKLIVAQVREQVREQEANRVVREHVADVSGPRTQAHAPTRKEPAAIEALRRYVEQQAPADGSRAPRS